MGGFGSGQWQTSQARETVEGCLCLNIFKLSHEGIIVPGAHCKGRLSAGKSWMSFTLRDKELTLEYRFSTGRYAGHDLCYTIQIVETRPHYGGIRLWFLCPTCGKRCAKLYLARLKYECRICGDLAYQSTRELSLRRALQRSAAVDRRIARLQAKYGLKS